MPDYWYDIRKCVIRDDDDEETVSQKKKNLKLVANNKPYFMTYVYPSLRTDNNTYIKNNNKNAIRRFWEYGIESVDDLYAFEPKTKEMLEFLRFYEKFKPTGDNACVVNRISWLFEKELDGYLSRNMDQPEFDYTFMKSNCGYSAATFKAVSEIYDRYLSSMDSYQASLRKNKIDKESYNSQRDMCIGLFKRDCEVACSNEKELCDIVLDLCYNSTRSKQFAWDICGDTILDNLVEKSGYANVPIHVDEDGDFVFGGEQFKMTKVKIGGEADDYTE